MDTAQAAELPEGIVSRQTVVSASLDIQGHEVHAEAFVLGLEQVVGHLLGDDVVVLLPGLGGETHQELVQLAGAVDEHGVKETVSQRNSTGSFSIILNLLDKAAK